MCNCMGVYLLHALRTRCSVDVSSSLSSSSSSESSPRSYPHLHLHPHLPNLILISLIHPIIPSSHRHFPNSHFPPVSPALFSLAVTLLDALKTYANAKQIRTSPCTHYHLSSRSLPALLTFNRGMYPSRTIPAALPRINTTFPSLFAATAIIHPYFPPSSPPILANPPPIDLPSTSLAPFPLPAPPHYYMHHQVPT